MRLLNRYYDDWMKTSLQSKVIDRIKEERGYWISCEESVFYVDVYKRQVMERAITIAI